MAASGRQFDLAPSETEDWMDRAKTAMDNALRQLGAEGVRDLDGQPENMVFALPRELRLQLVEPDPTR